MGRINRPPSSEQLNEMRELVAQGMKDGAFGLSTGLVYVPGTSTSTEEIIELAKVAGRLGGHYQSHIRSEGNNITTAVAEAIKIGEQGKLPAQVTHHKAVGQPNWKKSLQTLRLVDSARAKGLDVTIDQYPYTSVGGNIESSLFRPWVLEGSHDDIVARLNDPKLRAQIKQETANIIRNGNLRGNLSTVVIARCSWDESLAGKTLADLARLRTKRATPESGADVAMWILEQGGCGRVSRDSLARTTSSAFSGIPRRWSLLTGTFR
jgi:N-acyl-D-amino-acid deacylase